MDLICPQCGQKFSRALTRFSKKYRAKNIFFCSHECARVFQMEKNSVTIICANCGTSRRRTIKEAARARTGQHFCSNTCAAKYLNAERSQKRREKYCIRCNELIGVGYRVKDRLYCSIECQHAHMQEKRTNEWLSTGVLPINSDNAPAGKYVRDHIMKEQDHKCEICKISTEWCGKPLMLILDHIDGNGFNHRRENLRLICPNCESQSLTYKGRNRGLGRKSRRANSTKES